MLEDSGTDSELIQQHLLTEMPQCTFEVVMDEESFVLKLESFKPDVILSDNTMPRFDATRALELFNNRDLQIPFILVTGTVSEEFAAGIIKLGADDYILKDRLGRLPAAIDAALKHRRIEAGRQQAQRMLVASEERYRLLFQRNLAGICQSSAGGRILSCNDAFARMLGYTAAEAMELHAHRFYFSVDTRDAMISRLYREGQVSNRESVLRHRDGSEVFVIENITLHRDSHTGEDVIETILVDITERKKAEYEIRFAADLLKTVGQAVIATDMSGKVIYWNKAAEKIYGWSEAEATGMQIVDLTAASQAREQASEIMQNLSKGEDWSGEFPVRRKDGTVFPAYVTDSPVYDHSGKLAAIIGVSVDLTESKQSEENLRLLEKKILEQRIQEQKRISRAIIKAQEEEKNRIGQELHDNINQILVSSKLYLNRAGKQNPELQQLLQYPMELIDMSIEEIRQLSRRQVTPLRNIDLEKLIAELPESLGLNKSGSVDFVYNLQNENISDDLKLNIYRLIQEQLNNIVKHAGASRVEIIMEAADAHILIQVSDNGKGFDTRAQRTGIGISNMINRVESFNGTMDIQSSPGQGCCTRVKIPL